MEPLLCARHPAGDSWAWPGQHIHRFPAAKRASPLCGPALVSPCLTDSVLKSPSLAFSAPVLAPPLDLHSNRRLSQNHRILLSHIFRLWRKLISVAWPRQWDVSSDACSVWTQKLGAGIAACLGVSLQCRTIRTPRRDFPGGPGETTFQGRGCGLMGSIPSQGTKIPHVTGCSQKIFFNK